MIGIVCVVVQLLALVMQFRAIRDDRARAVCGWYALCLAAYIVGMLA